jgi:uncharacterized membrane protein YphA (DoxX/SURF4 family)
VQRSAFEFPTGWNAIGLLLIRLALGVALIWDALPHVRGAPLSTTGMLHMLSALAAVLLTAGYRTRSIGGITAVIEISQAVFGAGEPLVHTILAVFATGLALQGAGAWSMDARRAGWKRIDIPRRR